MTLPGKAVDEARRLALAGRYRLRVTGREPEFDRVARQAADLFDMPIALVSLVLEEDQRSLGSCGLDAPALPREATFCAHAILGDTLFVVPDMLRDPRFAENRFVVGEPHIRCYAGAPLVLEPGLAVGTLCLMDTRAREFAAGDRRRLEAMAETVVDLLRHRVGTFLAEESRSLLRATLDSIEQGVLVLDPGLTLATANARFFDLLDIPARLRQAGTPLEALVRDVAERGYLGDGPRGELVRETVAAYVRGGDSRVERTREGGRTLEFWRNAMPDGRFVLVVTDVSERKRVERMKDEFISTVSHELRTPLTSVAGALGLLRAGVGGQLTERGRSLLENSQRNADRLVRIINDLLDLGKMEAGSLQFHFEDVALAPLLRQAVEQNLPYAERLGVALDLVAGDDVVARADPHRIQQVMANLLSNAAKFTPAGSAVTVTLAQHGGMARVSVADQGPGIPEGFRDRVFEKFAQADSSDRRSQGGTGLGLSIARGIVEAHGGRISFETGAAGTTFHVDLPLSRDDTAAGARPRVLLVTDDPHPSGLLAGVLDKAGLEAERVASFDDAIQALSGERPRPAAIVVDPGHLAGGEPAATQSGPEEGAVPSGEAGREGGLGDADGTTRLPRGRPGAPLRILHVEDDADLREVVAASLRPAAQIVAAASLGDARAVLATEPVDLVILDIALPDGSGLDLLPLLQDVDGRSIPIILFSAYEPGPEAAGRLTRILMKSKAPIGELVTAVRALVGAGKAGDRGTP